MTTQNQPQLVSEIKECGHKYDCGCYRELCKDCIELLENGDWDTCDNECCNNYYTFRNDNCDCEEDDCMYCEERKKTLW